MTTIISIEQFPKTIENYEITMKKDGKTTRHDAGRDASGAAATALCLAMQSEHYVIVGHSKVMSHIQLNVRSA